MRSAQSFHVYTLTHCCFLGAFGGIYTLSWLDILQLFDQLGLFLFLLNKYSDTFQITIKRAKHMNSCSINIQFKGDSEELKIKWVENSSTLSELLTFGSQKDPRSTTTNKITERIVRGVAHLTTEAGCTTKDGSNGSWKNTLVHVLKYFLLQRCSLCICAFIRITTCQLQTLFLFLPLGNNFANG